MVITVAVLLEMFGSLVVAETVAELLITPVADEFTLTRRITGVLAPADNDPRSQVRVPEEWLQVGVPGVEDKYVTEIGRVSDMITLVASEGPLLKTVTV